MTTRQRRTPLLAMLVALALAACGSGSQTSARASSAAAVAPSASASASASPSASAEASASPSGSAEPSDEPTEEPEASPSGDASASADGGSAAPSAAFQFNDDESRLIEQLRPNANQGCEPRRENLPDGATAGVECEPGEEPVARVGIYGFEDSATALDYYTQRMEAVGIELDTGACGSGKPGDAGAGTESDGPDEPRVGCFLDEFGQANVRVLCGDGRYVGVLGTDDDIRALHEWTVEYEPGQSETGGPSGICLGPAGGIDTG